MSEKKSKLRSHYDHKALKEKWGRKWQEENIYSPDFVASKKPFYNLMMFPYASAEGLHVGNMYAFTGADVYGRFKRMQGYDVFEPIGLDGFGIHSENYAIKVGKHPKEHAQESEKNYYRQLSEIGNGFAWDNRLETYDPDYYRWTQWLFIQMFKAGLAYKDVAVVNWCPSCKTVLADEQVLNNKCERCGHEVERKEMSSWFFRITNYADKLLDNLKKIDWPEKIVTAQRQWIGKKEGAKIKFKLIVESQPNGKHFVEVFTTRLDTIYGATFLVISPELAKEWIDKGWKASKEVKDYIKRSLNKTEEDRKKAEKEKTGVNTQVKAINPANNQEIPVFVADYVLVGVGTGAIMGVPAHDSRDYSFAKKHDLLIKEVVKAKGLEVNEEEAYEGEGILVNSDAYNGFKSEEAREKMLDELKKRGIAQKETTYHLRDWLISRQRYWGPPIPMIYCDACAKKGKGERKEMPGWYSVNEKDLPILLPDIEDFKPKGEGASPLSNAPSSWKETKCPVCKEKATRELDVSDTFLDSSWYFLRYPSVGSKTEKTHPWDPDITKTWLPVDAYVGGAEHAVLHLLYSRFMTMALKDMGKLNFEEPFPFLYGHGLIIKDGSKMSKSKGNIVVPDEYIRKFGADTLRTYLMFLGPYDQGGDFRDTGMEGMRRFLMRVWDIYTKNMDIVLSKDKDTKELLFKTHQTIKKVTKDIENFRYNTAIASTMEYVNALRDLASRKDAQRAKGNIHCAEWDEALNTLALLIAPFAPYMAEELWVNRLGQPFSVHTTVWPKHNPEFVKKSEAVVAIQVNGKFRGTLTLDVDEAKDEKIVNSEAKKMKNVSKWIKGKEIKEIVFVPGKIINFVIG